MTRDEQCEWDPKRDEPATTEQGCSNPATVCVGRGGQWHLCDDCAKAPRFARFRCRLRLDRKGAAQ